MQETKEDIILLVKTPQMGNKTLLMVGSVMGHLVYGLVVALSVPGYAFAREEKKIKTAHAY